MLHVYEGEQAENRVLLIDLEHAGPLLPEDRARVFDGFRRLAGSKGGLNLALPLAKRILELHGGNGVMLDFGVEKIFRDAAIFLHMDATVDISKLKIVKSMFPATAGAYAGPEG